MSSKMHGLFEAVREACSPAVWSRGIELSRAGAVQCERADDEEALFRVAIRGGMISRTVSFYIDDTEWECGCDWPEDACEHAAAAVITWRRTVERGADLTSAGEGKGRIGYRFTRSGSSLALARVIIMKEGDWPLETTLAALDSGRVEGPPFIASQADLAAELALGTHRKGPLPRRIVARLFRRLAHCSEVALEGEPVTVAAEPVLPLGKLVDHGEGFRLSIEEDPAITERFDNGALLCGDRLRPLGEIKLTGRELHELPGGRYFGPGAAAELVTEVLPALSKRVSVEILTERLPQTIAAEPVIHLEVDRRDDVLCVMATLVYGDPPQARIDGGRLTHLEGAVPLRDERAEGRLLRRLRSELGLVPGVRIEFVGEEAVAFAPRLERWQGKISGEGHGYFRQAPPLAPQLSLSGSDFRVEFESAGGGGRADAAGVFRAWRDGRSLVPLLEGGWSPLPVDWLERYGDRVMDLLAAKEAAGGLPASSLPDLARLCEELEQPAPPGFEKLEKLLHGFDGIPRAELPADLQADLRTYQVDGVNWLNFARRAGLGVLLADDMGLGKTLQALCAIEGRTLVVAPTSVLHNWADEIRRFRPALSFAVYHGPNRKLDRSVDVTLSTYAILRLDADTLAAEEWDTVVLDEAQAIKNPDSQVAAAAYRLQARFRMTLTGTPVENRLEELWSQFHFINRGLLGGRQDFNERYSRPIADGEPGVAGRLRERIRPFMLRRMKQQVAPELPPRTEVLLRCELNREERELYDTIRAATLADVVERLGTGGNVLAALEALLRLRQAACHAGLVPGREASRSSKIDVLLEALGNVVAEGHKALVFSQWTSLLDLTEPHLEDAGIEYLRLDGSTRDRAGVVRAFQESGGPPVMLISLKAGGTGLNLTAADHVFLLDPWWNPAVEDQAADRTHRIGQDRPVMVYRLVARETVEEKILALQERKRALADAALGEADRAGGITRDELLELLR
jgi:superfamily II DNA or RNA helicase